MVVSRDRCAQRGAPAPGKAYVREDSHRQHERLASVAHSPHATAGHGPEPAPAHRLLPGERRCPGTGALARSPAHAHWSLGKGLVGSSAPMEGGQGSWRRRARPARSSRAARLAEKATGKALRLLPLGALGKLRPGDLAAPLRRSPGKLRAPSAGSASLPGGRLPTSLPGQRVRPARRPHAAPRRLPAAGSQHPATPAAARGPARPSLAPVPVARADVRVRDAAPRPGLSGQVVRRRRPARPPRPAARASHP